MVILDPEHGSLVCLAYYGIGTVDAPEDSQVELDLESWINKPLAEYINSYLIVDGYKGHRLEESQNRKFYCCRFGYF